MIVVAVIPTMRWPAAGSEGETRTTFGVWPALWGTTNCPPFCTCPQSVPPSSMAETLPAVRAALLFGAMNVVPGRDVVP